MRMISNVYAHASYVKFLKLHPDIIQALLHDCKIKRALAFTVGPYGNMQYI
jgi:hypothetical protein